MRTPRIPSGMAITLYVKPEDHPLLMKAKLKLRGRGSSLSQLLMEAVRRELEEVKGTGR